MCNGIVYFYLMCNEMDIFYLMCNEMDIFYLMCNRIVFFYLMCNRIVYFYLMCNGIVCFYLMCNGIVCFYLMCNGITQINEINLQYMIHLICFPFLRFQILSHQYLTHSRSHNSFTPTFGFPIRNISVRLTADYC
jgi:hypothetical protein